MQFSGSLVVQGDMRRIQCITGMGGWKKPKPFCIDRDMQTSIWFSFARTL